MQALSSPPFDDYRVWWSLSDSKYAGTALFVKKQCQPKIVWFNVDRKGTISFYSIYNTYLQCLKCYFRTVNCGYLFIFFLPNYTSSRLSLMKLHYSIVTTHIVIFHLIISAGKHEPDGRVILAEFETLILLNTYSPNNGWKDEDSSFKRRRKWDKRILEFVQNSSNKPLIWCGDLNVRYF